MNKVIKMEEINWDSYDKLIKEYGIDIMPMDDTWEGDALWDWLEEYHQRLLERTLRYLIEARFDDDDDA